MGDFASEFIQGHAAGRAAVAQRQRLEQEQEEHKLRVQAHKLALDDAKLQQAIHARQIALQDAQTPYTPPDTQGTKPTPTGAQQPSAAGGGVADRLRQMMMPDALPPEGTTGATGPNLPPPSTQPQGQMEAGPTATVGAMLPGQNQPRTIPGIAELGIPERQMTPPTVEEALRKQQLAQVQSEMYKPYTVKPGENVVIPGLGSQPIASGGPQQATDDFGKYFLPAYAAKMGKTVEQLTPDEKLRSFSVFTQAKADPELRGMAIASKNLAMAVQQMALGNQPKESEAEDAAKLLIHHQMAPEQLSTMVGGFGANGQRFKRMVLMSAMKQDPEFNFEQASAEYQLVKSPQFQQKVRLLDHVTGMLPRIQQSADRLGNTPIKKLNDLLVGGQKQFGGVDIKTFLADRELVANELGNVLSGGTGSQTSDAKIEHARELVSSSDSPAQIAATLAEVGPLLRSRRETLTRGTYMNQQQGEGMPKVGGTFNGSKVLSVERVQ